MIVEINDRQTIADITNAFNEAFPFLTIRFFKEPHQWGASSSLEQLIDDDRTIGQLGGVHNAGMMEIHGWHKTGAVEQAFNKLFRLYVQVFRHEGAAWVQTADTDPRTLEEQNEAARNASQELMDGTDNRFNHENPS